VRYSGESSAQPEYAQNIGVTFGEDKGMLRNSELRDGVIFCEEKKRRPLLSDLGKYISV